MRLLWQCLDIATLFSVESVVNLLWRKILCQRCMHSSFPLRAGSHRCKVCNLFCVRVMDQGQLALDGGPFEQDFVQMFASKCLKYHAVVRSKGANSWINVRSPLLVLTAIAVHGKCRTHQTHQLYRCHQVGTKFFAHAVVNSSFCFLSRCCRCFWCRVALCAASLFSAFSS